MKYITALAKSKKTIASWEMKPTRGRPVPRLVKIVLIVHFIVIVVGVNYLAPGSKFQQNNTIPQQINAIKAGLSPTPRAGERALRKAFLETMTSTPMIMAWGSSRALSVGSSSVGVPSFLNVAASYGTFFDLAALLSIFERTRSFPEKLVVMPDGWMLNANVQTSAWNDYGGDVERGLEMVGMAKSFGDRVQGPLAEIKILGEDFAQITSLALFRVYLVDALKRLKDTRSIFSLVATVRTEPFDKERNRWDRDLSYWYPCVPKNEVQDRARRWGTEKAAPGEKMLEGSFSELDPKLIALFRRLLAVLESRGVRIYILFPPLHPLSYADMNSTRVRQLTLEAEKVYRQAGQELGVPVFGSYDPSKVGLSEGDFCTDALHIRPDVMKRVFDNSGLAKALVQ